MSSVIVLDSSDEDEAPAKRISIPRLNPATTITIVKKPATTKNNKPSPAPSLVPRNSLTITNNNNNNNINLTMTNNKAVISNNLLPPLSKAALAKPKPSTLPKINAAFTLNPMHDGRTPTPPKRTLTPTRTSTPTTLTTNSAAALNNVQQQQQRKRKIPTPPKPKTIVATPPPTSPLIPMMMMMNNASAPMMSMFNSMNSMAPSSIPPLQLLATPATTTTSPSFANMYQPAMQAMQAMQSMHSMQSMQSMQSTQQQNKDNFKIHLPLKQPNSTQPNQPVQPPKPLHPPKPLQPSQRPQQQQSSQPPKPSQPPKQSQQPKPIATQAAAPTTATTTPTNTASILRSIKRIKPTTLLNNNDEAWLKRQQKPSSSPTSFSMPIKYNDGMEVFPTSIASTAAPFSSTYPLARNYGAGATHIKKSTSHFYPTPQFKPPTSTHQSFKPPLLTATRVPAPKAVGTKAVGAKVEVATSTAPKGVVPTAIFPSALFPKAVAPKAATQKPTAQKIVAPKAVAAKTLPPKVTSSKAFTPTQMTQAPRPVEKPYQPQSKTTHNANMQRFEASNPSTAKAQNSPSVKRLDTAVLDLTDSPEKSKENSNQSSRLSPPSASAAVAAASSTAKKLPKCATPKFRAVNGKTTENGSPATPTPTKTTESNSASTDTVAATKEEEPKPLEPLIPAYEELLKICREADTSDDMEKLIKIKLLRYYYSVHPDFVHSKGFLKLLRSTIDRIKADPDLIYYNLKTIIDELKVRRKKAARVEATQTLETNQDKPAATEQEESFSSTGNKRTDEQIKKLNKALYIVTKQIEQLEESEVDWDDDDSSYLKVERYKKRACQIYEKICDLTGENKSAMRLLRKPIQFNGTNLTEFNRTLQAFINQTKEFPDYFDVVRMLEHCNTTYSMGLAQFEIKHIAQDAFIKVGKLLQSRRKTDLYETVAHYTANSKDPATTDPTLLAKLSENQKLKKNINEIFEKFARKQDMTAEETRLKRAATAASNAEAGKPNKTKKKSKKKGDDAAAEDCDDDDDDDVDDEEDVEEEEEDDEEEEEEEDDEEDEAEEEDVEMIEIDNDIDKISTNSITDQESDEETDSSTKQTSKPTSEPQATPTATTKQPIVEEQQKAKSSDTNINEKTKQPYENKISNNNNNKINQDLSTFVKNIFARSKTDGATLVGNVTATTTAASGTATAQQQSPSQNGTVTIRRNAATLPNNLKRASPITTTSAAPALKVMSVSSLNDSINQANAATRVFNKTPASATMPTIAMGKGQNSVAEIVISDEES